MASSNPYNAYKQNSVKMASKQQLLLMLVDGAVKYTKIARLAIEKKDITRAHNELVRVQDIFTELMVTLASPRPTELATPRCDVSSLK